MRRVNALNNVQPLYLVMNEDKKERRGRRKKTGRFSRVFRSSSPDGKSVDLDRLYICRDICKTRRKSISFKTNFIRKYQLFFNYKRFEFW